MSSLLRDAIRTALLLVAASGTAIAGPILVAPDGTGDYPTIQAAIDASTSGDEILLTDGTFTGDGNRDLDTMGKAIRMASQSGDPALCVIDCEGTGGDPHRAFVFDDGETEKTVLEGITIRNGYAENGGAIVMLDSHPTIRNARFEENEASDQGGAIYSQHSGSGPLQIDDSWFERNVAESGGAIAVVGGLVSIFRSEMRGNSADHAGAVLDLCFGMLLQDCVITGNHARYGAGLVIYEATDIVGSTIAHNRADETGGGIWIAGIATVVELERTVLWGNCAPEGADAAVLLETNLFLTCSNVGVAEGKGDIVYTDSVSQNPFFCDPADCADAPTTAGDYTVDAASVCLPAQSPCGAPIGAFGEGCENTTPTETVSWGALKSRW